MNERQRDLHREDVAREHDPLIRKVDCQVAAGMARPEVQQPEPNAVDCHVLRLAYGLGRQIVAQRRRSSTRAGPVTASENSSLQLS